MKEQLRQAESKLEDMKKDKLEADGKTQMMAKLMTSLDIENDTQKKHIIELE